MIVIKLRRLEAKHLIYDIIFCTFSSISVLSICELYLYPITSAKNTKNKVRFKFQFAFI